MEAVSKVSPELLDKRDSKHKKFLYKPYTDPKKATDHGYMPEPEGEAKPYRLYLAKECPNNSITVFNFTFSRFIHEPISSEKEGSNPEHLAAVEYFTDNEVEAIMVKAAAQEVHWRTTEEREDSDGNKTKVAVLNKRKKVEFIRLEALPINLDDEGKEIRYPSLIRYSDLIKNKQAIGSIEELRKLEKQDEEQKATIADLQKQIEDLKKKQDDSVDKSNSKKK
ncbi:MAG: hypothetical protein KDD43_00060 [Bdellovibrionales bacterium]|nr:hypothetical protein [Bdellovibrionales bacterium]